MKTCPNCSSVLTPGASDCARCGAVFENGKVVLPSPAGAKDQTSDLVVMRLLFTLLAIAWPFTAIGALFMFDSPGAGGIPTYSLSFATVLYGPIYIAALVLAKARKRAGDTEGEFKMWLYLCGGNVAIWFAAFFMVLTVCGGRFACR